MGASVTPWPLCIWPSGGGVERGYCWAVLQPKSLAQGGLFDPEAKCFLSGTKRACDVSSVCKELSEEIILECNLDESPLLCLWPVRPPARSLRSLPL